MNTRLFWLSLLLVLAAILAWNPTHTDATQAGTIWSYCISDGSGPTVYVSRSFDSGMSAAARTFNGSSIAQQFNEYLKGRFDLRSSQSSCSGSHYNGYGPSDAESARQDFIAKLRKQNTQVVELPDWTYVRDEVAIKASFALHGVQGDYVNPEGGLPLDHFYCISESFQNTVFYNEPIVAQSNINVSETSIPWFGYLQQKYSFKGDFRCSIYTGPQSRLYLNARLAGARAAGKKLVNTGWDFRTAKPATQAQAPQDDDREPPPRPAGQRPAPSVQVRDLAAKEVTPALTLCRSNRAILQAYDCVCLQVKIYEYRIAHPADTLNGTPTLASFFDGKGFECAKCLSDSMAKVEAREKAKSAGLRQPAAQDCVAEKFVTMLHARPIPSQAPAELNAAIKACQ
jgi:hypothetical protein